MKDDWTILDLKNPPDLTVDYFWQTKNLHGSWIDAELETLEAICEAADGRILRYRPKPKKRTLDDVAKQIAYNTFLMERTEIPWTDRNILFAIKKGFRAALSGEYDDIELED